MSRLPYQVQVNILEKRLKKKNSLRAENDKDVIERILEMAEESLPPSYYEDLIAATDLLIKNRKYLQEV